MKNYFQILSEIDVTPHVRQKGEFSYLSWPFAVEVLGQYHPDAEIQVKRFPLPLSPDLEVPYLETPLGFFVEVSVIINGVVRSQLRPVLDRKNKPATTPDAVDINTSIQRTMVKAIAFHGLGLHVYQGEDLPLNAPDFTQEQYDHFMQLIEEDDALGLYILFQRIPINATIALNGSFPKGQKVKMKEVVKKLEHKGAGIINEYERLFVACIDADDSAGLLEAAQELGEAGKTIVWQKLNNEHQIAARQLLLNH
jgi:hypothetical protein